MDVSEFVSKLTEIFTDGVEAGATFALGDPTKASTDTIANSTKLVELAKDYSALTAEVTALRARVAELEAEAAWVSVEERLPEPEYTKWCIVQDILRGVYPAYFRDGLWWNSRENERCGIDIEGVILWRKLPKAIKFPEAE